MADILIGNVRGPQGVQGDPGEQGVQGEAATIEVGTVSTTAYGNPAQVTNSGTESEAVLDFVIPAGRPGEETTSMSALTLDTITAQTAAFPVPAVGERGAVVFGKIIKFFTDTVASLANKLNISDVVNNLTSTATNKPLSAAQGKALNDALGSSNTRIGYLEAYAGQMRSIKVLTLELANSAVISNTAGQAKFFQINGGCGIAFFTLAFRTTGQREANTAVFRLKMGSQYVVIDEPYNLICTVTDGTLRYSSYITDGNRRWIAVPAVWNANTEFRITGVSFCTIVD